MLLLSAFIPSPPRFFFSLPQPQPDYTAEEGTLMLSLKPKSGLQNSEALDIFQSPAQKSFLCCLQGRETELGMEGRGEGKGRWGGGGARHVC